jgi:hypothetical protein
LPGNVRRLLGVAVDQRAPHDCLDLGLRRSRTHKQRPAEILLILASGRSRPAAATAASDCV